MTTRDNSSSSSSSDADPLGVRPRDPQAPALEQASTPSRDHSVANGVCDRVVPSGEDSGQLLAPIETAKERHLMDVYEALGVRWGDEPFGRIKALQVAEDALARLTAERKVNCESRSPDGDGPEGGSAPTLQQPNGASLRAPGAGLEPADSLSISAASKAGAHAPSAPHLTEPPARRVIVAEDLQDILKECGHRGDSANVEYVRRMGLRMAFYPDELLAIVQMFLDAEYTRMLLRGTLEGWKARTHEKIKARGEAASVAGAAVRPPQELARQVESKVAAEYPNKADALAFGRADEVHPSTHSSAAAGVSPAARGASPQEENDEKS